MTSLVGPDGVTPLRRILTSDIAGAQVGGARNVLTAHPASGLDPLGLTSILRAAEFGAPVTFLELAEQMEEKYPHYNAVLGTRKRQVAQLDISVEAASDEDLDKEKAQVIRDWLKRDTVEAELFDMQDALGKGFAMIEIIWQLSGRYWLPERLEWRDPRWFEFDRTDGRTPLLRGKGTPQPLPPFKFIMHTGNAKSGLPIRGGLARIAAWSFLFQNFAIKDWVSFAEVYGFPIRVGKYGAAASGEQITTLLRAVSSISQDAAAVIPDSMQMEFIANNSTGSAELYRSLAEYCDKAMSKLVLGQTATTDSEGGGLGGSGKEHNDVRGDIERADAKALAATLNRDLVKPIIDFNFGRPKDGSPPKYPQINIGRADPEDTKLLMDNITSFVAMGGQVAKSVVADKLGLPDVLDGEEVLVPANSGSISGAPQNGPTGALPAPGGPVPPKNGAPGFLGPLKTSYGGNAVVAAAADPGAGPTGDDIDDLVQLLTDEGWQAVMGPIVDPLTAAMAGAGSYEEALAALVPALSRMDSDALAQRLERAAFAVRAAAKVGATEENG
jgi:phage gp29-like protein